MYTPFIILCLKTLVFWFLVVFLHQQKYRITIIPLYAYIAILTILMHNFTDLDFAIVINQWFFLISSFSLFTTLMFGTLFLYLFEGPRAGRVALWVILFSSLFYIGTVYFLGFEVDTTKWVQFNLTQGIYYFWSLFSIILDVIFLAISWELLSRIKSLNLATRVFLVIFGVFALDAIVFTTGAFRNTEFYFAILKGSIIIRFVLSLIGAPIMAHFLKSEGFAEEKRNKPKNFWEIMNFRSDLELEISTLEATIKNQKILEEKLKEVKETYELAINGSGAGIWDWNIITNEITWSPKFYKLLGYTSDELEGNLEAFKSILHPDDIGPTFAFIDRCFKSDCAFEAEYRLKTKSGQYRWFMANAIIKYDGADRPLRMVGTIIDINSRKDAELSLKEKIDELTRFNKVMLGRELKMIDLKKEISDLRNQSNQ